MLEFKRVEATDLYSFEDLQIDYEQGLTLVTGKNFDSTNASSNYSGKSNALVEIPLWILYEKGTKEISPAGTITSNYTKESVIRIGAPACWGRICFELNGEEYSIQRGRDRKGNSELMLQRYDEDSPVTLAGKDKVATQKMINMLIGEYDIFTQVVFYAQGTKRFTEARDSERKAVLESLLDMGDYSSALKLTKDRLKEKIAECTSLQVSIEAVKIRLEEVEKKKMLVCRNLKDQEEEYKYWKEEHDKDVKDAEEGLKESKRLYSELLDKKEKLESDVAMFHIEKEAGFKQARDELEERISEAQAWIIQHETEIKIAKKKITKLKAMDQCPECLQEVTEDHKCSMLKLLEEEVKDKVAKNEELENVLIIRQGEIHAIKSELEVHNGKVLELSNLIARELKKAKEDYEIDVKTLETMKARKRKKPNTEELDNVNTEIHTLLANVKNTGAKLKLAERGREDLEFWEVGFGNAGIKSLLLDSILPVLNKKANEYASVLVGEPIDLEFDTEFTLKSGAVRDRFDVRVKTDGGEGYHLCSGGQRSRINFAVALALQSLQASRGSRTNLFICDEPFESVDTGGQDGIIDLLEQFANDNKLCVYIITHLEDLKARFTSRLEVIKQEGVSKIT